MPQNSSSKLYKFENRFDAAVKLLDILPLHRMKEEDWLIVAISKGAIPIANFISKKLFLELEIIFMESIYALNNQECIVAMVSETEDIVSHKKLVDCFNISLDYIYGEAHRKHEEKIIKNLYIYKNGNVIDNIKGKNILMIDEGCESGLTALTALKSIINQNAKSVSFAVPVIPKDVQKSLLSVIDEIFYLYSIEDFIDVEYYYKDLYEVESDTIKEILSNNEKFLN